MPTGYTAVLTEKDVTFQEFAMSCARAFGACITMRDDPNDAPIPDEFKPDDYHVKALRDAEDEVQRLSAMTSGERLEFGAKEIREERARILGYIEKRNTENARYASMLEQVKAWKPPTPDHEGMKKFMVEQLEVSMGDSRYLESQLAELGNETSAGRFNSTLAAARENIEYHRKHQAEEVGRANTRTQWVRDLRNSLLEPVANG